MGARLNSSRVRPALVCCLLLAVLITGLFASPAPSGHAVLGEPSIYNPGQVRIYEQGRFEITGTLVDRNWVLTTASYGIPLWP